MSAEVGASLDHETEATKAFKNATSGQQKDELYKGGAPFVQGDANKWADGLKDRLTPVADKQNELRPLTELLTTDNFPNLPEGVQATAEDFFKRLCTPGGSNLGYTTCTPEAHDPGRIAKYGDSIRLINQYGESDERSRVSKEPQYLNTYGYLGIGQFAVRTMPLGNADSGSDTWKVLKNDGSSDSGPLRFGDKIKLINQYTNPDSAPKNAGYLNFDAGWLGNGFNVSTMKTADRGTWEILRADLSSDASIVQMGDKISLVNSDIPFRTVSQYGRQYLCTSPTKTLSLRRNELGVQTAGSGIRKRRWRCLQGILGRLSWHRPHLLSCEPTHCPCLRACMKKTEKPLQSSCDCGLHHEIGAAHRKVVVCVRSSTGRTAACATRSVRLIEKWSRREVCKRKKSEAHKDMNMPHAAMQSHLPRAADSRCVLSSFTSRSSLRFLLSTGSYWFSPWSSSKFRV